MWSLYKKELSVYFKTPMGYIFLALILFFTGTIFTLSFLFRGNQNFSAYLQVLTSLFAIISPLLTMRLYSDEFKHRTDQLLFCLPLRTIDIVLAKLFAVLTIFSVILLNLLLYLSIIFAFGNPDWAHIASAFIGFILLGTTLLSIGSAFSSYTQHQLLAAMLSFICIVAIIVLSSIAPILPLNSGISWFVLLFMLAIASGLFYAKTHQKRYSIAIFLIGFALLSTMYLYNHAYFYALIPRLLRSLSPLARYQSFNHGIINISDLYYFIMVITVLQYLIYINLEKHYYKEK